jgi:hypothetical protein
MMPGAWHLLHGRPAPALLTLGFVLLVVPGFYLIALYFAVPGVNVLEEFLERVPLVWLLLVETAHAPLPTPVARS